MKFCYNDGGRSNYFKASRVRDCAIRAICNATNKDYKEVYSEFKKLNKGVSCRNGTPKKISKKYLTNLGWKYYSCVGIGTGVLVHLNENELPNKGTLVVQVSKHLTCVINNILNDTYDCTRDGERSVYGIWYSPKNETKEIKDFIKRVEDKKKSKIKSL